MYLRPSSRTILGVLALAPVGADPVNDRAFSMMIRERDGFICQRCGKGFEPNDEHLQCAHMFGRWKPATRVDPDNAAALCWLCHGYLDTHPMEKRTWFRQRLGDKAFEALQRRSNGAKVNP